MTWRQLSVVVLVTTAACGDLPGRSTTGISVPTPATVPPGILAAVPFQNRLDVAQGIFQVKLYNGTDSPIAVSSVQLRWDGLTTPTAARENMVAAGDRIDFPVPLAPATCRGDGTAASMPDPGAAVVRARLTNGDALDIPVFDLKGFAEKLYLEDCERQRIEQGVGVAWTDLRQADLDGRPVTEGHLRIERRAATGVVTLVQVGNTVNFTLDFPQGSEPIAVLATDADAIEVPVRILEGRCDAHARSESSQPFAFVAVLDLGDGLERALRIPPPAAEQPAIRERYETACVILGDDGFVGE